MKKIFDNRTTAAAALWVLCCATLSSCTFGISVDEQFAESGAGGSSSQYGDLLGFKPMVTNTVITGGGSDFTDPTQSRASLAGISALQDQGFTTYGYKHLEVVDWELEDDTKNLEPNYMCLKQVSYSNGTWSYSPIQYWPQGELLSFFGLSPLTAVEKAPTYGDKGAPIMTVTVPADQAQQIDLLAGVDLNNSSTASDTDVNLQFKHTMAKIGFSARLDYDMIPESLDTLRVHSLKVYYANGGEFRNRGTYSFIDHEWTLDDTVAYGQGELEGDVVLEYGEIDNPTEVTCLYGGTVVDTSEYRSPKDPDDDLLQGVQVISPATVVSLNAGDDYLMLLPQDYNALSMFIEVIYSTSTDATPDTLVLPIPQIKASAEGPVIPFEVGKSYTFLLTLDTIRNIEFGGVQVGDWNDGGYYEFDFYYPQGDQSSNI